MEQLARYMSFDDWNDLGPVNRVQAENDYAGTEREPIDTPYWANVKILARNPLLNPNRSRQADGFTSGHGQFFHLRNVLSEGGPEALKLVREAAKLGDKATEDAERIGGHPRAWTLIAGNGNDSPEVAGVIRGFVDTALEFHPAGRYQELPKDADTYDFAAFAARFEETASPKRFRSRVIANGRVEFATGESTGQKFGGVVAVAADKGKEGAAVAWMREQSPRLIFAPEKNRDLWNAAIQDGKANGSGQQRRKLYDDTARGARATEQMIDRSDAVAVFWNGDARSNGGKTIATAARSGKLAKVMDDQGRAVDLYESANECMAAHMSKKEYAQSRTMGAFDLAIAEPAGRFALSLVRDEKLGTIGDRDINKLGSMSESLNDIAAMAETSQGREHLESQKISKSAIRLLGDGDVMSRARTSFLRINKQLSENGVEIVGPEDYPQSWLGSGQFPPYAFVQGDKEMFRGASDVVGVIGHKPEADSMRRMAASRSAPAISALAESGATVARVEEANFIRMPIDRPQILLIGSGHAHAGTEDRLAERKAVLDAGGVIVSHMPPDETGVYYDHEQKQNVAKKAVGNAHSTRKAADQLGAMSSVLMVTEMNASRRNSEVHAAIESGLRAGRRPAPLNYNDLDGAQDVSGNRSFLTSRGTKALTRAGFGDGFVEEMDTDPATRKPGALEGSRMALMTGTTGAGPRTMVENILRHGRGQASRLPERARSRGVEAEEL